MTTMTAAPVDFEAKAPTRVPLLTALLSRRTWLEFSYLWLTLLLSPFALAYVIGFLTLSVSLVWTVVGLYVGGVVLLGARGWGSMYRGMARTILGTHVAAPARFVWPKGFWRKLGALFVDGDAWRALLFTFLTFPLSLLSTIVTTTILGTGLGAITYPVWYRFTSQQAEDGTWHHGSQLGTNFYIDTPFRIAVQALVGVALLLVFPWAVRAFALLSSVLTRALLGPTQTGQRVAALRATRAAAVTSADARLRAIERDLHDGPQARLVAVAMQLGEARSHLAAGTELEQATSLVDSAHAATKETLVELREIVRGIHPPALDAGLPVALETLAARSPLPVSVAIDPTLEATRPLEPVLQSLVYYAVAELLANVAKHSGASSAALSVAWHGANAVVVTVTDDGRGGAAVFPADGTGLHTGLAGLAERVAAVDGSLDVSSPTGGPTVVTVTVPTQTVPTGPGR
jgi:signal transduction histidine kinase